MTLGIIPKQEGGKLKAIASGTLPNGKPVVVNSDGTVSVISASSQNITQVTGGQSQFNGQVVDYLSSAYDENANRIVIVYTDGGASQAGTAIVGSVSGSGITFGTEVVFSTSGTAYNSVCYDQASQKIVVLYSGSQSYGRARVGTVDPATNSISFGTEVVFRSANTTWLSATYHEAAQRVVVSFLEGNSNYGVAMAARVIGTTLVFGSLHYFLSAQIEYVSSTYDPDSEQVIVVCVNKSSGSRVTADTLAVSDLTVSSGNATIVDNSISSFNEQTSVAYDRAAGKIVVAYDRGYAAVGTVSGTSLSFGTPVSYSGDTLAKWSSIVYHPNAQKVVVAYYWFTGNQNEWRGYVRVGTVSGTSVSFTNPTTFLIGLPINITTSMHTQSDYVFIGYKSSLQSNYGKANMYRPAYTLTTTNLTSENYIGISSGGPVTNAKTTIDIVGTVNTDQSGLTPGQKYYVQIDGTLDITPATPSVLAGTAISDTKLLVKS